MALAQAIPIHQNLGFPGVLLFLSAAGSTIDAYTWHVDKFCQHFGL